MSRTVTAANYFSTSATLSDSLITIRMSNIINAYKAGASGNFFWQITDPNGTTIDQGPPTSNTVLSTSLTFVGGTFQCIHIPIQPAPSLPLAIWSAPTRLLSLRSAQKTKFLREDRLLSPFPTHGPVILLQLRLLSTIPHVHRYLELEVAIWLAVITLNQLILRSQVLLRAFQQLFP